VNDDLRRTAAALDLTVSAPYRVALGWELDRLCMYLAVGRWRHAPRDWHAARCALARIVRRLPHRDAWGIWQCEGTLSPRARRGLTARAAERRMLRDEIHQALDGLPKVRRLHG
jgi:hypothetical protein